MFLIKLVIEKILGGSMEKMLKSNNSMTSLNTLLLLFLAWMSYSQWQTATEIEKKITNINHALFYRLNIRVNEPDRPDNDSRRNVNPPDIIANRQETTMEGKKEN